MVIKSVREISFFQNLRDKELKLCFCNFMPDKNNEETVHFINFLVSIAKNHLAEKDNSYLEQLDKDCLNSLAKKLEKHTLDMRNNYNHVRGTVEAFKNNTCCVHALQISGNVTLSFVELINLYEILEYFENNYEAFKNYIKNTTIPHQLINFSLTPSAYYNALYSIKDNLENKIGELVVNSYKIRK